jgi:hypothetical protein
MRLKHRTRGKDAGLRLGGGDGLDGIGLCLGVELRPAIAIDHVDAEGAVPATVLEPFDNAAFQVEGIERPAHRAARALQPVHHGCGGNDLALALLRPVVVPYVDRQRPGEIGKQLGRAAPRVPERVDRHVYGGQPRRVDAGNGELETGGRGRKADEPGAHRHVSAAVSTVMVTVSRSGAPSEPGSTSSAGLESSIDMTPPTLSTAPRPRRSMTAPTRRWEAA